MRIHREGYATLAVTGTLLLLANLLVALFLPRRALGVSVGLAALAQGFLAQFFRDPPRRAPRCPDCVIAPADGTIVAVERAYEGEYFHDERLKISIYMSAFNVHVNRVPLGGKVIYSCYHPGRYLVAFHPKSSELNERNTVVIRDSSGKEVLIRQIAGILARRIVYYLEHNQDVVSGQELGFIKFGSRCDVFLPLDCRTQVAVDQVVTGGETILAKLS